MIDADTGNIHLPNGFVITPALTSNTFRRSWFGRSAAAHSPAASQEQWWFEIDAGVLGLRSASLSLNLCEHRLVGLDLQLIETCYFGDVLQEYFATERATKLFHDDLLRHDLGEADCYTKTNCNEPGLDKAPNYLRTWGKVVSDFDWGAGNAYISIEYNSDTEL